MSLLFALLQLSTILAEIVVSRAFEPQYNWIKNTISELGVGHCTTDFDPRKGIEACSPLADVMNWAMIFSGFCLVILAVMLWGSKGFSRAPGVLWILAGLGTIATGFITLDTSPVLHQAVSAPLFFGAPLAITVGSFQLRGRVRIVGMTLGVLTLILGVLFSATDWVFGYGGIVERLVIWPSLLWIVFLAASARKEAQVEMARRFPVKHGAPALQPTTDTLRVPHVEENAHTPRIFPR